MSVYRRYFEVTEEAVIQAAREIQERVCAHLREAEALAIEFGFERAGIRQGFGGARELAGFSITDMPADVLKREWKELGQSKEGNMVYAPRRSLKVGKQRAERMKQVGTINDQRDLKVLLGLEKFPDAWGSIGSSGYGVHYATVAFLDGEAPVILASLPFEKVEAEVPPSLADRKELTEHQYMAHFDRVNSQRAAPAAQQEEE